MHERVGQPDSPSGASSIASTGGGELPDALADALDAILRSLPAEGVALLRPASEGRAGGVIAAAPASLVTDLKSGESPPAWVSMALEATVPAEPMLQGVERESGLYDAAGPLLLARCAVGSASGPLMLAAGLRASPASHRSVQARLSVSAGLIESLDLRTRMIGLETRSRRLAGVIDAAALMGDARGFLGAAMDVCNDVATRHACDRVSLGFLRGNRARLVAMSHRESLDRRSLLVQAIEEVMEECADQDAEVASPTDAATIVNRCAESFRKSHDMTHVLSLPLRVRERSGGTGDEDTGVRAVLTLERAGDRPFTQAETIDLRMFLDVVSPALVRLHETDRWVGSRLTHDLRRTLAWAVGPRNTLAKAIGLAAALSLAAAALIKGDYRVEGTFTLDVPKRLSVPAPFDGFLREARVKPNDRVEAGITVLAVLDDSELKVEAAALVAEREAKLKEAAKARTERKISDAAVAEAEAEKARARLELVRMRIARSTVVAPAGGVVLVGDLDRMIGSPVKTGDVLFELAPTDSLHADVAVPEDQVGDVSVGQSGMLATAAYPSTRIPFTVERIDPLATVDGHRNVFNARVRLGEVPEAIAASIRPGMQGVAKIDADRRSYLWIWTRRLSNWVRMQLWL
ncbi:MAG: hypothetical protein RL689_1242 [Planctomycetota bacterium]|jgi:biotin carboxyl carrier protein